MVTTLLVEQLIVDGARLLLELDRREFQIESMFWIEIADQGYWRLVIASKIVAEVGGADAYRRLSEILQGIAFFGISLADISLMDPDSQRFELLRPQAATSKLLTYGKSWAVFDNAVVYRWKDESIQGKLTCDVSEEDLARFWDAERNMHNQPDLLLSLQGRRVTIRFHPKHGTLTGAGIENIKPAFRIALRRQLPDCNINWLL